MKNKFVTLLLSCIIAFGLWAYVVTNVSVTDSTSLHNVPVVFQNEGALTGRNLMLTEGTSQTVTLNITGTRSEILKLRPDNVSVVVDLSRIYDAGRRSVEYTVNYPSGVVSGDFEYTADKPRITLTVEEWVEKDVPVYYGYEGKVGEGYMVDYESIYMDYRRIRVSGPASMVEPIKQARFTVFLDGLTQSLDQDYEYTLCDEEGNPVEVENVEYVRTDVEKIHLKLDIQRYKTIKLKLDVLDGAGATEETSTILLDTDKIVVSGPDELLEALDQVVLGTLDLAEIKSAAKLTFPVTLPNGVINRSGVENVNVSVSFPALITKTFTITNIQPVNVPADTVASVVTRQINVKIRGPRSMVQRMQPSDISVTVDFGDMQAGATVTRQPNVTVSANFPEVGILECSPVTISLQEKPPETEPPETEPPETEPSTGPEAKTDTDPNGKPGTQKNGTTG